jgi:hypothetical protein
MRAMLANLVVRRVVAHQVFERDADRRAVLPKCSTGLTNLDQDGRIALQKRLGAALGDNSHAVDMTITRSEANSTFHLMAQCLEDDDQRFIACSKTLVTSLADAQASRRIPGGVVIVLSGVTGSNARRFAAVVKAETDDGFTSKTNGDEVSFEFQPSLFMTAQQKLYKVGFFLETTQKPNAGGRPRDPSDFRVLVYDHNMTAKETQNAALYFYEAFLGCSAAPSSAALTRSFYHQTREFIDGSPMPDAEKLDAYSALYTFLKVDQRSTFSVGDFASRYLKGAVRDLYRTRMREAGFPTTAVNKDLAYLTSVLRRRRLRFTSDVSISAPAEGFGKLVKILPQDEDGSTHVQIAGTLSRTD